MGSFNTFPDCIIENSHYTSIVLKYDYSCIFIIYIEMFIVGVSNYYQKEGKIFVYLAIIFINL